LKEEGWDGARTTSSCELRRKTVASEGASSHPRGECQIEPFNALKFGAAALAALIQERNRQRGRKINPPVRRQHRFRSVPPLAHGSNKNRRRELRSLDGDTFRQFVDCLGFLCSCGLASCNLFDRLACRHGLGRWLLRCSDLSRRLAFRARRLTSCWACHCMLPFVYWYGATIGSRFRYVKHNRRAFGQCAQLSSDTRNVGLIQLSSGYPRAPSIGTRRQMISSLASYSRADSRPQNSSCTSQIR